MAQADGENDRYAAGDGHSYFVPMVDMLAGVVFILVILLAAATLVSRNEFKPSEKAQAETARIRAELEAARRQEHLYLDPRREAALATRTLLDRLANGLRQAGYTVETSPADSELTVRGIAAFTGNEPSLSTKGGRLAADIAEILGRELPCVTSGRPASSRCAAYPAVKLETVEVRAVAPAPDGHDLGGQPADAQSLVLMSAMIAARPNLLGLRSPGGTGVFTYGGVAPESPGALTPDTIALRFQMAVPPIPKR